MENDNTPTENELIIRKDSTFLHDNKEVKLTQRFAKRELSSGRLLLLVEIVPLECDDNKNFAQWVKFSDLCEIKTIGEEDEF